MKILLTGKDGKVGFELQRSLAPPGEVVAVDLTDCDLCDAKPIRQLVAAVHPKVIVNPAADTAVDKAESDQERAAAVNTVAPGVFGEEAAKLDALVVHYSTDYVFDGTKDSAYSEADPTSPQSVYGFTKRDGELALANANPRHLILRSTWAVGANGGNFAKTMLKLAAERGSPSVVADQWGAPTSAVLLADLNAQLIRQWQREGESAFPTASTIALLAAKPTGATTPALSLAKRPRPTRGSRRRRKPSNLSPPPTTPCPPSAPPTQGLTLASSAKPLASSCHIGKPALNKYFSRYFER
jgi:dTDP-4-dehydrorhamnose reductase